MSECYADLLKDYPNKGVCGLPELVESTRSISVKVKRLVEMVQSARRVVIFTGAGISTSAGIPDFRGPTGIWTIEEREKKRKKRKKKQKSKKSAKSEDEIEAETREDQPTSAFKQETQPATTAAKETQPAVPQPPNTRKRKLKAGPQQNETVSFEDAQPTLTHRAITKLAELDVVKYCITQNVDGLHRRSGIPRSKFAVLHGCVFTLKCERCGMEYFQKTVLQPYSVGLKRTGQMCSALNCGGHLRDTLLDWDDELPDDDWKQSQEECSKSDLVICLGTSLRIQPAGELPLLAREFVIVNKQITPLDNKAALVIRANCDDILSALMDRLGLTDWQDE